MVPGRKNQQAIPIGQIVTRSNPLNTGGGRIEFTNADEILSASAQEYSEKWRTKDFWDYQKSFKLSKSAELWIDFLNRVFDHLYDYPSSPGYDISRYSGNNVNSGFPLSYPQYQDTEVPLSEYLYDYGYDPMIAYIPMNSKKPLKYWFMYGGDPTAVSDAINFSSYDNDHFSGDCGLTVAIQDAGYTYEDIDEVLVDLGTVPTNYNTTWNPYNLHVTSIDLKVRYKDNFEGIVQIQGTCLNLDYLLEPISIANCDDPSPNLINPFLNGIRGNFRPLNSYTYKTDRQLTASTNNNVDLRHDGIFDNFHEFWAPVSLGSERWSATTDYWVPAAQATLYSKNGSAIETLDAIGNYQSIKLGYAERLPVMVADNAMLHEIYNENFEDYHLNYQIDDCNFYGTNLRDYIYEYSSSTYDRISDLQAHTGKYSLRLEKITGAGAPPNTWIESEDELVCSGGDSPDIVDMAPGDCYQYIDFTMGAGTSAREYILSCWVKEEDPTDAFDYSQAIEFIPSAGTATLINKSGIIEGWQRLEYKVTIPASTVEVDIEISNGSGQSSGDVTFLDDLRIYPFGAVSKAFVYDPVNFRYSAELDENNFATFYEYNAEGKLSHVKKETRDGIVTIQESQSDLISK
ncbi:MAG: hypothetical protein ACPF9D_04885 [Owenweeksia sp.]